MLAVVVFLAGALLLSSALLRRIACFTEENEALIVLRKIQTLEGSLYTKTKSYDSIPRCTFGDGGKSTLGGPGTFCTGARLTLELPSRSRFSYAVEATPSTYTAHALGTTGNVLGSSITLDHTGKLDRSGSVCGAAR